MKNDKEKARFDDWLAGNGIGDEGAMELSEMLKENKTLTSLYLCGKEEG